MRRIPALALACLLSGALSACAQSVWVDREQLVADPADPAVLRFAVELQESGSYEIRLLVRGESEREIRLELALRPEAGGPVRSVHFSFTGRGCGWKSWLRVTGGERVELEAGPYAGTLSPRNQKDLWVFMLILEASP